MRTLILLSLFTIVACTHPAAPLAPHAEDKPLSVADSPNGDTMLVSPQSTLGHSTLNLDQPSPLFSVSSESRNLVCERIKLLNDKAECTPEFSDAGEGHIHTARVKYTAKTKDGGDVTVTQVCGLAAGQLSMACGDLLAQPAGGTVQHGNETTKAKGAKK